MMTRFKRQHGFTLIEAIMVIVITGIIAGVVAVFIRSPVQGYFDMETRIELSDTADTAMRRIGRDLRLALPNSVRPSGSSTAIEFLQTRTGGRYRADVTGIAGVQGNALKPGEAAATTFDVLGDLTLGGRVKIDDLVYPAIDPLVVAYAVVYNLGIAGADAYNGDNSAAIKSATVNSITLKASTTFPLASPGKRFQIVDTPVTYRCDLNAGTLTRHWGYAITSAQANPPIGGTSALIAQGVSNCVFNYDQINERYGLVSMRIWLTRNKETVSLYHEVHVNNVP